MKLNSNNGGNFACIEQIQLGMTFEDGEIVDEAPWTDRGALLPSKSELTDLFENYGFQLLL
jgi:hypothetical protein